LTWDPATYLRFGDERGRPFLDLVAQIGADAPEQVVDLGCGPGNLTALLTRRWPSAKVLGTDNSTEMIARAKADFDVSGVTFEVADVVNYLPSADVDVLVSNAVLQWVPSHRDLLVRWARAMAPGSWLAFQVPGNFDAPGHVALREVADSDPAWADRLGGILRRPVDDPSDYAQLLEGTGASVDAWETTYSHRLVVEPGGPHPVLAWQAGTALRPVRGALSDSEYADFSARLGRRLEALYPVRDGVVRYPFRRVFVVARPHAE
jgi:trans-aconitate 2-methyltransferase